MNHLENPHPKTLDRFLRLLKMKGPQPAAALAAEFGMTVEGARLQLARLTETGLVSAEVVAKGVGRPNTLYRLTDKGHQHFPDAHPELTVQLLSTVKHMLGQNALETIVNARGIAADRKYTEALEGALGLEEKLDRLVSIRSAEGYMAEWKREGEGYLFIENHCPIGSAAKYCEGFCRAELNTLLNILGPEISVQRTEHLLQESRRCAYRIIPDPVIEISD